MSNTALEDAQGIVDWLSDNSGYWNSDLLEIKKSKLGGVGVFAKTDIDPSLGLTVLLRLHKGSIFSAQNSTIANLLFEDQIDGALGLILAFIYEKDCGEASPWYPFIKSVKYTDSKGDLILPPSLWPRKQRELLKGSEIGLMGALDDDENQLQFQNACEFAARHHDLTNGAISIPWEFDIDNDKPDELLEKYSHFIAISHAVASRDFQIDEFHEVALVPGACLFNHSNKPTVRFESLFEVCGACGSSNGCDHVDDEGESEDDDDDDDEDMDDEEAEGEDHEEFNGSIEEFVQIIEKEYQLEKQEEQLERDALQKLQNGEASEDEKERQDYEDDSGVEDEADGESEEEEEEEEEDDDDEDEDDRGPILFEDDDKLISPDDCCDIVLTKKVQKGEELFNTYGDFNNSVLLSKYGFVIPGNNNNSVGLGMQFLKLKKQNKKLYFRQFDWWEAGGYLAVRDMLFTKKNECEDDCCKKEEKDCHNGCCDDEHGHNHDEDDEDDDDHDQETPNWTMEVEILHNGEPSPLTFALLKLLSLNKMEITKFLKNPEKINLQILTTKSSKALKILQELVEMRLKEYDAVLKADRLLKSKSGRERLTGQLLKDEVDILQNCLKYISKKV